MCGIVGFICKESNHENNLVKLENIKKTLYHRGPDDHGIWHDKRFNVYLGHQRLSILDLSYAASQPMESISGRYVIIYNGEIYNHLSLRNKINKNYPNKVNWKSTSDTETLVNYIDLYGFEATMKAISGMFAFAIWDNKNKKLILCRDSIGEKPLYYGWVDNTFIFSSELKAFQKFPNFKNNISKEALSKFFRYSYVPNPLSIYEDIYKLQPGCYLEFKNIGFDKPSKINFAPFENSNIKIQKWWHLKKNENFNLNSKNEIKSKLIETLNSSVKSQMISDVKLGSFLSGGIDSSLVAGLMQKNSINRIDTFTIGFDETKFDETKYASAVSKILNTNHNELILNSSDIQKSLPLMPNIYDEPFSDSSQIPTFLLSKFARQKVTVCLSGDGGDELFGGYNRYLWSQKIWKFLKYLPLPLRKIFSLIIYLTPEKIINNSEGILNKTLLKNYPLNNLSEKLSKLRNKILNAKNFKDFYVELVSEWENVKDLLNLDIDISINNFEDSLDYNFKNNTDQMMYFDLNTYLPDDILCKVDRASMNNSLETRSPFLNSDVVNLAFNIPLEFKINNSKTKWILREILKDFIPDNLINRPKMGFSIPLASWLRGPLKEWCYDTLNLNNISSLGLNKKLVSKTLNQHMNSNNDQHNKIWSLMIFTLWYQNQNSQIIK